MLQVNDRDLRPSQMSAGEQPAVAGEDLVVLVDQDRCVEAERLDALRDLPNLRGFVDPRILRIEVERVDGYVFNSEVAVARCRAQVSRSCDPP